MSGDRPEPKESTWRGWLVIGPALVIAAALLIINVMPNDAPSPTPPRGSPTPTAANQHEVVTDEGIVSFRLEDGAIVIRLARNGKTTELGRTEMVAATGTAMFVMVCGPADGPGSRRYFFGHVDVTRATEYSGPQALGRIAFDGLFLFALLPPSNGAQGPVQLLVGDEVIGSFRADIFARGVSDGERQPSGCFVLR